MMDVSCINRAKRIAVLDDGQTLSIANFLDADGDETDDADSAVVGIAPDSNGKWWSIDLSQFSEVGAN
jgi:hypothetical protein